MTLKEAREKGKLVQFIREKEKELKPADTAPNFQNIFKIHFHQKVADAFLSKNEASKFQVS
jgi:hypothetical protein